MVGLIIVASSISFWLGYASHQTVGQGRELSSQQAGAGGTPQIESSSMTQIVASKYGTKYYLTSCSGADRISEKNKVYFASAAAALAAGYAPASGCKGL